jgi:hypothetical protein
MRRLPAILPVFLIAFAIGGCSPKSFVFNRAADAFSSGSEIFQSDDDPELVRESVPFGLKAMESILSKQPQHAGLLTSLSRGFTQYSAAFVLQDALEAADPEISQAGKERAGRLFLRARDYGLRGLQSRHPGFREEFPADPAKALSATEREDAPLLFWTGVSWSMAINAAPGDPELLGDLPKCEALMRRALALAEDLEGGAVHEYFIAFEGGRPEAMGGSAAKARSHFKRAMEISGGKKISPMVTLAETVSVRAQDRKEFLDLLDRVLSFDARGGPPKYRLSNLVAQRKARWLKRRADELFLQ